MAKSKAKPKTEKAHLACALAVFCADYAADLCTPSVECPHEKQMVALKRWAEHEGLPAVKIAALERQAKFVTYAEFFSPLATYTLVATAAWKNCEKVQGLLQEESGRMRAAAEKAAKGSGSHIIQPGLPKAQIKELRDNLGFLLLLTDADERERRSKPGPDGVQRCAWCGAVPKRRLGNSGCCPNTGGENGRLSKCALSRRQQRKRIRDCINDGFSSMSGGQQTLGEMAAVMEREMFRFSIAVTAREDSGSGARPKGRKRDRKCNANSG